MRKFKFRGKRKDNGEWVCGDLITKPVHHECVILVDGCINYSVDPKTVGQYAGFKGYWGSYNNRKQNEIDLFEGDIVEAKSQGSVGVFEIWWRQAANPAFILFPAWQSGKMWNIAASDLGRNSNDFYDDLRLLGNKYDNPELLKR